ncbi:MAG: ATP-binding protein [Woeseiaceae bacterium]
MSSNVAAIETTASRDSPGLRRWALVTVTGLLVLAIALMGLRWMYSQQASLAVISDVLAQEISAAEPALAADDRWLPLSLPDKLCRKDCTSRFKIYRATIATPDALESLAVYLPMFDGAAAVYLNGHKVGQSGSMQSPTADMTYQPTLFALPRDLFEADVNYLDVVVAAQVPAGGRLIPFHVAAADQLTVPHATASFLTVGVLSVFNGIFLVLGFCALLLYGSGDRDRMYLWFVLLLVFSAVRNLNILLPEWPASLATRNWMYLTSTLGVLMTMSGLVSRFAMRRETWVDIGLVLLIVPASLLIWFGLQGDLWVNWIRANTAIRVLGIVLVPYALIRFLLYAKSLPVVVHSVIFGLLTLGLVLVLHDIVQSWPPRRLVFQLSNLAALPLALCFCVTLVSRYAGHLAAVQSHNRELRAAVAARERELAESHQRETEQARQQTLGAERQRIMRDMHDGVAGRLAVMLQQLRRGGSATTAITEELQRSLQDLRLTIDSLDEQLGVDFAAAMSTFREHVEPIVREQGVGMNWRLEIGESTEVGPEKTLQIYRCLQEGINNVLRHAGAAEIDVQVTRVANSIEVAISDDGRGIAEGDPSGRGIGNMRERIESVDGAFDLASDARGTRLRFTVPLDTP